MHGLHALPANKHFLYFEIQWKENTKHCLSIENKNHAILTHVMCSILFLFFLFDLIMGFFS